MPTRSGDGTGSLTAEQRRKNRQAIQAQKAKQYQERQAARALARTQQLTAQRIRVGEQRASLRNVAPALERLLTARPSQVRATKQTAQALGGPLVSYLAHPPVTQANRRKQQEAGLAYQNVLKALAVAPYHDVRNRDYPLIALDALAALSLGTGAAARGIQASRAAKQGESVIEALKVNPVAHEVLPRRLLPAEQPEFRGLQLPGEGGKVQLPLQSQNLSQRAIQEAYDRLSEAVPNLPAFGARSRVARRIPEMQATRQLRMTEQAIPLAIAAKRLRGWRGTRPAELAYTVVARYGHTGQEGVGLIDREIRFRQDQLRNLAGRAAKRQQDRIDLLEAAKPLVENPPENLANALALGRQTSDVVTQMRRERGLSEEAIAGAPAQHIRIVHGARFVTPAEAQAQRQALGRSLKNIRKRKAEIRREIKRAFAQGRLASARTAGKEANRAAEQASRRRAQLNAQLNGLGKTEKDLRKVQARLTRLSSGRELSTADIPGLTPGMDFSKARIRALGKTYDESVRLQQSLDRQLNATMLLEEEAALAPELARAQEAAADTLGVARAQQVEEAARQERALGHVTEAERRIAGQQEEVRTGLVGAEDVTPGPEGFFTTDREERRALGQLFARAKSLRRPRTKFHPRTGQTFTEAREQVGPTVTVKDYLREVRLRGQQADADLAESFSRPFDPEKDADLVISGKLRLLNPEAKTIRRDELADVPEVELESLSPVEIAGRILAERTEWARNTFPAAANKQAVLQVAAEHPQGLRVLDAKIAKAIEGLSFYPGGKGDLADHVVRAIDGLNNFERFLLVYANPAYGPVQRVGNYAFRALQSNVNFINDMQANTRLLKNLDEEDLRWIDMEVGGGAAQALAHEPGRSAGVAPFRAATEKVTDIQQIIADRGPRRQAWITEARREGFDTPEKIRALRNDPALEQRLNVISERAQQAMVKFRRVPTRERRALSKVIFILPWVEGSTRYVGRLILDRPLTARVSQEIRRKIEEEQKKILGQGKIAARGFIPFGALPFVSDSTLTGINPMGMSPFSTPADLEAAISNFATGKLAGRGLNPASFLQPLLTGGIEAATQQNLYGGYQYPSSKSGLDILRENLLGTTGRPAGGLANIVATAVRKPEPLTGPASKQPVYQPEAGPLAALERGVLGSARPRTPNLPAAQSKGRTISRYNMSAVGRARDDGKKYESDLLADAKAAGYQGAQLPPEVRQAIRARTAEYTEYARVGARTQDEMLVAAVAMLARQGKIPRSTVAQARKFVLTAQDTEVRSELNRVRARFFGSQVLADVRREIRDATQAGG